MFLLLLLEEVSFAQIRSGSIREENFLVDESIEEEHLNLLLELHTPLTCISCY